MHLVECVSLCILVLWCCMIYQNVRCEMLYISFHCAMLVWGHLDAWIIVARVLYDVNCCLLTELDDLPFFCILCVHPMSLMSTWVLSYLIPSLLWCNPCIFVSLVVSTSSSWSRVLAVSVLLGWICYIMMLLNLLLQVILCIIWRSPLRMFCYTCNALSIHARGYIYSLL